jgi:multimeric flavodoxin WrbA
MVKILGIVGSPRKGGNTEQLMERALAAARETGAETRMFTVAGRTIGPCIACDACADGKVTYCVQDDGMSDLYPLIEWADAIVFGSPVYMGTMSAQLKAVFDRARSLWRKEGGMLNKPAGVLVVGEGTWGRQEFALQSIEWAAVNHGMVVAGPDAEVCGVANKPGDILQDAEAMAGAERLGRHLARVRISTA